MHHVIIKKKNRTVWVTRQYIKYAEQQGHHDVWCDKISKNLKDIFYDTEYVSQYFILILLKKIYLHGRRGNQHLVKKEIIM